MAERGDTKVAAIASSLAGEIYGLETLRTGIEDHDANTTRFVVMAREPVRPDPVLPCVTSIVSGSEAFPPPRASARGSLTCGPVSTTA